MTTTEKRQLIEQCLKEHLVITNPKGIPFAIDKLLKIFIIEPIKNTTK